MSYATLVSIIDHAAPENPPYLILDGVTSAETTALDVINDLATDGWQVAEQVSFTMATAGGVATFISTLLEMPA